MVKVFISNCYVSDHILYSKCLQLANTQASSCLEKSFIPLTMHFCSKAVQIICSASFNSVIVLTATCWSHSASSCVYSTMVDCAWGSASRGFVSVSWYLSPMLLWMCRVCAGWILPSATRASLPWQHLSTWRLVAFQARSTSYMSDCTATCCRRTSVEVASRRLASRLVIWYVNQDWIKEIARVWFRQIRELFRWHRPSSIAPSQVERPKKCLRS